MSKIIAVHSYKGGTGKTLLSVNLAATLAKRGKKVCLFDLDFRAPSLFAILKVEKAEWWLNDYLNSICNINKVLIDLSSRIQSNGKFVVGLANPATEAIRDISAKDRKWEMHALGRLLSLRNTLLKDQEFDYLILDTSPGLQYSSINAIVSADQVLVATTFDMSDVKGTKRMLHELYELFEKKTDVIVNKVLYDVSSKSENEDLQNRVSDTYKARVVGVIPCFCDVSRAEGAFIFTLEKPEHPFSKIISEISAKIEKSEL